MPVLATALAVLAILACFGALLVNVLFQGSWSLTKSSLELLGLLLAVKRKTRSVRKASTWGTTTLFQEAVCKWPDATMMIMADSGEYVTFREMDERSNRVARWLIAQGAQSGDTICLFMPGSIDYVAIWLGAAKVGCVTALLNTNLTGAPLVHAIRTALTAPKTSRLVLASECLARAALRDDVRAALQSGDSALDAAGCSTPITVMVLSPGSTKGAPRTNACDGALPSSMGVSRAPPSSGMLEELEAGALKSSTGESHLACSDAAAPSCCDVIQCEQQQQQEEQIWARGAVCSTTMAHETGAPLHRGTSSGETSWESVLFYIYTSGTTGLPKASKINHLRFWSAG